jgi:lysyl-tRNA synthetase class I
MESQQLTQNVVVKLATEERGVKRLKAAPRNFSELIGVVRDQKKSTAEVFKITYVDDAGDEVAVSDDEDLAAAYDWATTQTNKNIKLSVKDNLKRRRSDSKEVKEVTKKFEEMDLKKNPQSQESESSSEDEKKGDIMHQAIGIPEHKDRK